MKIKVCSNNSTAIQTALDAINGRAIAQTINSPKRVIEFAEDAERRLDNAGVAKSRRAGVTAEFRPAGPAKSYRYSAVSTLVELKRGPRDWFLVSVQRSEVHPDTPSLNIIRLSTEEQRLDVIGRAFSRHSILPAARPTPVSNHDRLAAAAANVAEIDHIAA